MPNGPPQLPPKKKRTEDSYPAFPGARFPSSQVPATNSVRSRAYSQTHDKSGKQVDNLNGPGDQTTRRYIPTSKTNFNVKNNNGTTVGQAFKPGGGVYPSKSTGDMAGTRTQAFQNAARYRRLHPIQKNPKGQ